MYEVNFILFFISVISMAAAHIFETLFGILG